MNSEPGPIVVAGSHGQSLFLRVDSVPREGETVLATGFGEPEDGGKATNQAVAIAKLGVPVRLVTLLGNDSRGQVDGAVSSLGTVSIPNMYCNARAQPMSASSCWPLTVYRQ